MTKKKKWAQRAVAGTTVAALGIGGGTIAHHYLQDRGEAGEPGAVIDLGERNGMLLHDMSGRPAFANYFDAVKPGEMVLDISIATAEDMPDSLRDPLGQITKHRQKHVSQVVDPQDYRAIDGASAQVIHDFFAEFEKLTGITVNVQENNPDADIVIGGYKSYDNYIGFASFPQEIPLLRHLPQNKGFMMLDAEYLASQMERGNSAAVLALVAHEFGHNLGILHPHDPLIDTAMSDKQSQAVARMSYNNHTFPRIATTDINSGFGPLEIYLIRNALRDMGVEPPAINETDTDYALDDMARQQRLEAQAKSGFLRSLPALSLVDSGGSNSLAGSDGNDLLVTESGYCGLLNREENSIQLLRDGQAYCLVEGEFSLVRSGAGDNLILTANGTEQTVYLGTGRNEVALVHEQAGEKTIVADDTQEQSHATLTLHHSLLRNGDAQVSREGDDIVVHFSAISGRPVGKITLQGQAVGQGIDQLRVIDDNGETVVEYAVSGLEDVQQWQDTVITPAQETVEARMFEALRSDIARARQGLAGEAGSWDVPDDSDASESKDAVTNNGEEAAAHVHDGGCCPHHQSRHERHGVEEDTPTPRRSHVETLLQSRKLRDVGHER